VKKNWVGDKKNLNLLRQVRLLTKISTTCSSVKC
jgi:hypothetical protein